jgi:hypothetical protein
MPFANYAARSFTLASILNNAPEHFGLYGLCNEREWIFIAETANIQASLLEQLRAVESAVKIRKPTGFTFELCSPDLAAARKRELLRRFKPSCNAAEPGLGWR